MLVELENDADVQLLWGAVQSTVVSESGTSRIDSS